MPSEGGAAVGGRGRGRGALADVLRAARGGRGQGGRRRGGRTEAGAKRLLDQSTELVAIRLDTKGKKPVSTSMCPIIHTSIIIIPRRAALPDLFQSVHHNNNTKLS